MKKFILIGIITASFLYAQNNLDGAALFSKYGCYGCHGVNAQGMGDYPPLAGKPEAYLKNRLLEYKKGTIHSNRAGTMQPFAQKLSTEEIEAIAKYLSTLYKDHESSERYFQEFEIGDSSGS
ncbi:c-type cytochrome [Nitratiruptor sp. YY09-18]|uniref:c-type cytochrome n=1 Tax=Nitratiruptor sp. YY09-18 TaxID=2724901 RepID=UPI001915B80F|nr:c-type cytochrome [Nitratiruptor sp. YY09-18]BCD68424.1 hypothetical protein NitYY0918_C1339 [Nitratiruptor sp. YY09-18]